MTPVDCVRAFVSSTPSNSRWRTTEYQSYEPCREDFPRFAPNRHRRRASRLAMQTHAIANDKPTIHVLTSYAVRGTKEDGTLPSLRVVPLTLSDNEGKPCVQALWSAVRLMREGTNVRTMSERPFEANGGRGTELFAQAGTRDEGEVLRFGVATTSARDLALKALGRGSTREVMEGTPFDLLPSFPAFEKRVAYAEILRESLYEHALRVFEDMFDISRVGRSGIMLTSKLARGSWAWTAVSDAVAVLDQYTLDVEIDDENSARVLCTLGHELRSPLSVRQILDDPSLMDLPEGAEVVALGGPHLQGQLSYANIGGKKIGEPREDLKGDSLLSYHRNRYPARIALLEHARESDECVQLVQPGRPPVAYPAELLSPVIKLHNLDANTRDAIASTCAGMPSDLQRRVTAVRSMLGQPFAPLMNLDERMQRLDNQFAVSSGADTRRGSLDTGPAIMPLSSSQSSPLPPLYLLLGRSMQGSEAAVKYVEHLVKDVESTLIDWNASEDVIRAIKSDLASAEISWYDDKSIGSARNDLAQAFRASRSATFLIPLSTQRPFVEASARQAGSRVSYASTVRWAADDNDAKRICFVLIARHGGQATVCRDAIVPEDAYVVGAGMKPGLPILDAFGRVISRQHGAPSGATITSAVRTSIDAGLKKISVHHAGESDEDDIRSATELAHENDVSMLSLVDVLEHDFGRVLGWNKDTGSVVQPDRGFWSPLGSNDAVAVTTGMESNLVRGVARPLRIRRRLGDVDIASSVNQIFRLCSVDTHFLKSGSSFRLPLSLRSIDPSSIDVVLVRPPR
ncbi:hypothetical protein BE221DRAFT_201555 [Ostreococcus tauri]|uniref:Uncharacterized protein n=1 Tax=Ostreococcus tauri TaxID=70448 RepID=A0A1Y5HZR5_OSTTA|nr:hypothetical protein BE221DRAFT_201555 [Ostreococcus tauri]